MALTRHDGVFGGLSSRRAGLGKGRSRSSSGQHNAGAAPRILALNRPVHQVQALHAGEMLGVVADQGEAAGDGLPRDQRVGKPNALAAQVTAHRSRCDGRSAVESDKGKRRIDRVEA